MIVGTAGHIDHGKTTLVRALTGVDTDRLKEEKARGISIELGYAYVPLPDGEVLGFIDVPGHEKLVHTMAAGASGIDLGLLVVAADDGVMPQTREHLFILEMLGVRAGAVVLSKADRVDAERLQIVREQVARLARDTFLDGAPCFAVAAAREGDAGVDALRGWLQAQALARPPRTAQGLFRLAVDRAFTLPGHGTVVTGTVHGGCLRLDDETIDLRLMPAGLPVRVRGIHAQNRASASGAAGQRCALNLPGLARQDVARGDWVADARSFVPSRHVDVQLRWQGEAALRGWTPIHVHLGAAHQLAHALPLEGAELAPGAQGLVQLVFPQPVCAMPGDRVILRNAQASATVGGARVLDPNAPDRKRRQPQRLAWLQALAVFLDGGDWLALLAQAPLGLTREQVLRLGGVPPDCAPPGASWQAGGRVLITQRHWQALQTTLQEALARFHRQFPDEPGADAARLRRMACPQAGETLWQAVLQAAAAQEQVQRQGVWWRLPGQGAVLGEAEQALADKALALLLAGGFDPPWVRDLGRALSVPEGEMRQLLRKLLRRGELAQVVPDLFYPRATVATLAALVTGLCRQHGSVQAGVFRDRTGLGRKRAIQVLEFFDRSGHTRRLRDSHVLRPDSAWLLAAQDLDESLS